MRTDLIASCIALLLVMPALAGCGCNKKSPFEMNKQTMDITARSDARIFDEIRNKELLTEELDRLHDGVERSAETNPEENFPDHNSPQ